jgi:adenylate cyclase
MFRPSSTSPEGIYRCHDLNSKSGLSQGQRRLAAIMYTDMVGYTALGQRDESLSLALVEAQQTLLRPVITRHQGREVKTMGDAFLVEFTSVLEGVRCAYDIQRSVREFNLTLPSEKRIHIRVGIHLGEVLVKEGDILGDAVNVASRIEPLAEDGGVCLTRQVYDHVQNKLDFQFLTIGKPTLKNVSEPIEVYKILMPWDEKKAIPPMLDKNRIAILPFANMSPDPNDEYFADGMTEELISTTSSIAGLTLIARTSVMGYKGSTKKVEEIGKELGVGTVMEGSVRKAGNKLRITVQLIDVQSQGHLWAQSYDKELDDVFAIQSEIAESVAEALQSKLLPGNLATDQAPRTIPKTQQATNLQSYELYLRGRYFWNRRNKEGILESIKMFHQAIKLDPGYARAYAGLADAYYTAWDYNVMERTDAISKARDALLIALDLDRSLAEPHATLGSMLLWDFRAREAENEFRKAILLNPNYATAHHWYALCLRELARQNDEIEEMKQARLLDPLSPVIASTLAISLMLRGELDEAISNINWVIEKEPTYALAYNVRADLFALKNSRESAYLDLETFLNVGQDERVYKLSRAILLGWFGDEAAAHSLIQEFEKEPNESRFYSDGIAECYAILGESDNFFRWVNTAISGKRFATASLRYLPFYDKVRNDPRFPEIFKKLDLPYEPNS